MTMSGQFSITIISTGGTIEKTYDEFDGNLANKHAQEGSVLDDMLGHLELPELNITRVSLMNKDSLDMTEVDHERIAEAVVEASPNADGVLVVHGTDRLTESGECIHERMENFLCPVVLTGAMRPFELRRTDALQNLTESLLAIRLLGPGVWCVMHNKALPFPGVKKNRDRLTFE
jgi:L-asparaginase